MKGIEQGNQEALQALEKAFANGKRGAMPSSQLAIFQRIEKPLVKVRQDYLSGVLHFPQAVPFLGQSTSWRLLRAVWISAANNSAVSNSNPTQATTRFDRLGQNQAVTCDSRGCSPAIRGGPKRSGISEPELGFRFKSPTHPLAGSWGEVDRILYA